MSGYLLDTNVISMLAPAKAVPPGFAAWLRVEDREERVFISAVTLHELEKGIGLLERKGASAKAARLRVWLSNLSAVFETRILPVDARVAMVSGELDALASASRHNCGVPDAMIAGTAKTHGLVIVTRNDRHFAPFGVAHVSPEECMISE